MSAIGYMNQGYTTLEAFSHAHEDFHPEDIHKEDTSTQQFYNASQECGRADFQYDELNILHAGLKLSMIQMYYENTSEIRDNIENAKDLLTEHENVGNYETVEHVKQHLGCISDHLPDP